MSQDEITRLRDEAADTVHKQLAKAAIECVETAPMGSTVMLDLDTFLALRNVYWTLVEPHGFEMRVMGRTVTFS